MFSVHCVHCFRWPFAVDRSHPRKPIRGQQNRVYWLVRPPPTQSGATRDSVGGQGRECTFSWMPPGSRLHPEGRGEAVVGKCAARVCVRVCVGSRLDDWGQSRVNVQVWFFSTAWWKFLSLPSAGHRASFGAVHLWTGHKLLETRPNHWHVKATARCADCCRFIAPGQPCCILAPLPSVFSLRLFIFPSSC